VVKRWMVVSAIGLVSGCSSLLGFDKDYTLDVDAATDAPSSNDATKDVQFTDAPADAGDANADADADAGPALRQCQILMASDAAPIFCDDFDDGTPLGANWTQLVNQAPWSLSLASDASVSAPMSLSGFADLDASPQAALHEGFVNPAAKFVAVEADARWDEFSGPTNYAFSPLEVGLSFSSTPQWRARLDIYPDHAEIEEFEWQSDGGFGFDFNALTKNLVIGQWTHVRIQADLTTHTITVMFDGALVLNHVSKYQWLPNQLPYASTGMLLSRWGFVGPWRFHVDNVAIYAK
jgi:hypothetical protein